MTLRMMRVMRNIALLLSLFLTCSAFAADTKQLVDSTAFVIEEAFVDPERGRQIARELRQKPVDENLEGKALADALTKAIWSIEDDGHLNVRFDPSKAATPLATREELRSRLAQRGGMRRGGPESEPEPSARMLDGNIGVLELPSFMVPESSVADAMKQIENASAVIIDLRQNRGGSQRLVDYLVSYFFPADDRVILTARFRGMDAPIISRVVDVPTRKLEKVPVIVLTSDKTFSAGEACAFILQQFNRAKIIGQKTRGGGRPNTFVDLGAGFTASVSIGESKLPTTNKGWQLSGVIPDIAVDPDQALDEALKQLRRAAAKPPLS